MKIEIDGCLSLSREPKAKLHVSRAAEQAQRRERTRLKLRRYKGWNRK